MIQRFAASLHGEQLAKATELHREVDFLLAWPPGKPNEIGYSVRGVIDCLYQDAAGKWHVADFKTNDVPPKDVPAVAQQYELQLSIYAIAAERALGHSPAELTLHFLRPGKAFTFHWNSAARDKSIATMNDLITNATIASELVASATG
jgi:ATP-dependent helicase/nuclease subunit A